MSVVEISTEEPVLSMVVVVVVVSVVVAEDVRENLIRSETQGIRLGRICIQYIRICLGNTEV